MLSFQPPVKMTRASPALHRRTFNGENDDDKQKDNDKDKQKDSGDDEDGDDLEGQCYPTVVVVERD